MYQIVFVPYRIDFYPVVPCTECSVQAYQEAVTPHSISCVNYARGTLDLHFMKCLHLLQDKFGFILGICPSWAQYARQNDCLSCHGWQQFFTAGQNSFDRGLHESYFPINCLPDCSVSGAPEIFLLKTFRATTHHCSIVSMQKSLCSNHNSAPAPAVSWQCPPLTSHWNGAHCRLFFF